MDQSLPVPVAGGHLFRRVDAGDAHTCGVTTSDEAYCWGFNDRGVLGAGIIQRQSTPVAVSGGLRFRQVAAGGTHTCGVTTSDVVYCWGSDSVGQVGDGSSTAGVFVPTRVATSRPFQLVDAGLGAFTCGVTTADKAFCWGSGRNGEIGDGRDFLRFLPRAVSGGHAFDRVTTVARTPARWRRTTGRTAGGWTRAARSAPGRVWLEAWSRSRSQAGVSSARSAPANPTPAPGHRRGLPSVGAPTSSASWGTGRPPIATCRHGRPA